MRILVRLNADAHPILCRVDGCPHDAKVRGLCRKCYEYATAFGQLDDVALPSKRKKSGSGS